jgi:PEGA domain
MAPRRRLITATTATVFTAVLGIGSADAQRVAQRAPAPATQGRSAVPRPPVSARPPYEGRSYVRPPYNGRSYYRAPVYRYYYGTSSYRYGGFYGGYYYPFSFSVGIEPGYPYYRSPDYPYYPYYEPYPSYPFYRSYPSYPYYPPDRDVSNAYAYGPNAWLQLSGVPRNAEVFIDGFYAGTVDDFDGSYEGRALRVEPGNHTVEVFLPGYRTLTQKIHLQPDRTFTLGAVLEPLAPGETEPVRPGAPRP